MNGGLVLRHVIAFVISLLASAYLIPIMILAANKFKLLDRPDGKIKQHKSPVPHLGGLAVYVAFVITLVFVYPFSERLLWFLLGTTLLLCVGLIDDLSALTPLQKLSGQVVAVICFLKGGFAFRSRFFIDYINLTASGLWMLSVINAFNLVDVMDGLSSVLALVSALAFFVIALLLKKYMLSLLLTCAMGALFAFLFYNRPPAKIYLGDAGSLFTGGFLAAIPLLIHWTQELNACGAIPAFAGGNIFFETAISALVPILLVGVPLLEVTSLVVIRKYYRIPFYSGSPHHFASYLLRKGWSVTRVLSFASAMAACFAGLGIMFMFGLLHFWLLVLGLVFLFGTWIWVVLGN